MRRFTILVALFLFSVSIGATVRAGGVAVDRRVSALAASLQQAEVLPISSTNAGTGPQGAITVPQPDAFWAGLWGLVGLGVFSKLRGSRVR